MEKLLAIHRQLIENVTLEFKRFLFNQIDWNKHAIAIIGPRGVGKTTLLLQKIRQDFYKDTSVLYVSLDNIYFNSHSLFDFAYDFYRIGGKVLFLDEVHKYPNWSQEIKNIYDSLPDMKIVFTGSSTLQLYKGFGDLSRRVKVYHLPGLSFREFIEFETKISFPALSLAEIIENHTDIASEIVSKLKVFKYFPQYLRYGYYPFYKQDTSDFYFYLQNTVNTSVEVDLPSTTNIEFASVVKIKRLLSIITEISPFKPNISELAKKVDTSRAKLIEFLELLQRAGIIILLRASTKGMAQMQKPEKIFLGNPNLLYALASDNPDKGTLRETFFISQTTANHCVYYPKTGDFLVEDKWLFEIGGKTKTRKQIANQSNAYIAADDIEIGMGNKIPLWLFGFLY